MSNTQLLYLEDMTLLGVEAKVVAVQEEDGKQIVILDKTVFYPQGGGQPYDQGAIGGASGKFLVAEVRFVDGVVRHIGAFERGMFQAGDVVMCNVDGVRRELHSRLHSVGHVLDMAVRAAGLNWVPGKGYHFPDGAYVEYAGALGELDKEKLKADIEKLCAQFIAEDRTTTIRFMPKEKMHEVCHHVPDYLPEGKPARVVMYGDFGVPCGGTHVSHLGAIGTMTIRKIKPEGANVRVGYDVAR